MLKITDKANQEFKSIIKESSEGNSAPGLRVFSQSGGCCSSNQLGIELVNLDENSLKTYDYDGLVVVMDDDTFDMSKGATIDFFEHQENPGFKVMWENAHNSGACGCS